MVGGRPRDEERRYHCPLAVPRIRHMKSSGWDDKVNFETRGTIPRGKRLSTHLAGVKSQGAVLLIARSRVQATAVAMTTKEKTGRAWPMADDAAA